MEAFCPVKRESLAQGPYGMLIQPNFVVYLLTVYRLLAAMSTPELAIS